MSIIDETSPVNTTWTNNNCATNDLGYLLDHLSNILTDELWNRLLAHTWVEQCITDQVWYKKL